MYRLFKRIYIYINECVMSLQSSCLYWFHILAQDQWSLGRGELNSSNPGLNWYPFYWNWNWPRQNLNSDHKYGLNATKHFTWQTDRFANLLPLQLFILMSVKCVYYPGVYINGSNIFLNLWCWSCSSIDSSKLFPSKCQKKQKKTVVTVVFYFNHIH